MPRKLIMFDMVSLDGFFEDRDKSIDWHTVDEEFNDFAVRQLESAGGLLFGRVTYELMASYWPTADDDPEVASLMNSLPKAVASRTLTSVDWANTSIIDGDAVRGVPALKEQPGGDILLLGSANLGASLGRAGLIDEYRLMVAPLLLGGGRPLFEGVDGLRELRLVNTRPFGNGNVLLTYAPR